MEPNGRAASQRLGPGGGTERVENYGAAAAPCPQPAGIVGSLAVHGGFRSPGCEPEASHVASASCTNGPTGCASRRGATVRICIEIYPLKTVHYFKTKEQVKGAVMATQLYIAVTESNVSPMWSVPKNGPSWESDGLGVPLWAECLVCDWFR